MFDLPEHQIVRTFDRQPIDVWVNSFGGSRHNYIVDCLKPKYRTYNHAYEYSACHYIRPIPVYVGSGIFCYTEDVGIALSSQINRGMYHNFEKLRDSPDIEYNIGTWLDMIKQQINNWTVSNPPFPIVVINTDRIVDNKEKFESVYGVEMLPYKERGTEEILPEIQEKYMDRVEEVNKLLRSLPDFKINHTR